MKKYPTGKNGGRGVSNREFVRTIGFLFFFCGRCNTGEVHLCFIAHKTKIRYSYGLIPPVLHRPQNKKCGRYGQLGITSNVIETEIWLKSAPNNYFGSLSTMRSFTGAVLPSEASKSHTTPGGTQPSHDIVS